MTLLVWGIIIVLGLGTFLLKGSFLFRGRGGTLPPLVRRMLRYVPSAAIAAIIAPAVVYAPDGALFELSGTRIAAVSVAFLTAWKTRNIGLTLVVGMSVLWAVSCLG
ncbi:MAG: AzlD domain-containing protein [Synergistales bacterium]|nr:AzlD domain-containing protein [Synergistales bacterium]